MACCWVAQMAEIINPIPTMERMKRRMAAASAGSEPWKGMRKPHIPAATMTMPRAPPISRAGTVLARMISVEVVGDTSS